jgi:type VI secretion system secreted protein Hcp
VIRLRTGAGPQPGQAWALPLWNRGSGHWGPATESDPSMYRLMNRVPLLTFLLVALLGWASEASASTAGYLRVRGDTQGDVRGGVTGTHAGSMRVVSMSPMITSPLSKDGLSTGRRQHRPLRVTIEVDQGMPLLMLALANNENLSEVTVRMYGDGGRRPEQNTYTVRLTNATVTAFQIVAETTKDKTGPDLLHLEFAYRRIEITWNDGGITAMDDWETPVAASAPPVPKSNPKPAKEGTRAPAPKAQPRPSPSPAVKARQRKK